MLRVGVDCEEISRFRKLPYKRNKRFYRKIFTEDEIKYCTSYRDPYPRFAVRFAAKEATIKALNGLAKPYYTEIGIKKNRKQPTICLKKNKFKGIKQSQVSLSLTHSNSYAVAFVVFTPDRTARKEAKRILRKSTSYIRKRIGP